MRRGNWAILFDVEGVLADNKNHHVRAEQELFNRYGFEVTKEEILKNFMKDWIRLSFYLRLQAIMNLNLQKTELLNR